MAGCSQCRGRVRQRAGLDATVSWLRADLAAVLPQDHLSEEAIQAAAAGEPSPEANEHLRHCPACRAEMDDLRQFIASQRSPGSPGFSGSGWLRRPFLSSQPRGPRGRLSSPGESLS